MESALKAEAVVAVFCWVAVAYIPLVAARGPVSAWRPLSLCRGNRWSRRQSWYGALCTRYREVLSRALMEPRWRITADEVSQ